MKNLVWFMSIVGFGYIVWTMYGRKFVNTALVLDPLTESKANRGEGLTNEENTGIND